jgi:uncharacterized protein (DUF305 family)
MATRGATVHRPKARPAASRTTATSGRPGSWLARLGTRGWIGMTVAAAVIVGLLGFTIGLNVGRPSWPADGSADVGFARDMSAHHAQAVEMAMIAFQKASREDVRSLGSDIAMTQKGQIGVMQTWLQTWGVPANTNDAPMAWVPDGASMLNGNRMPGMATREEINRLNDATGEQVDILFLQLMIRHHLGGVHMIDAVLGQGSSDEVKQLAEEMKRTQTAEVSTMQNILTNELHASTLPN